MSKQADQFIDSYVILDQFIDSYVIFFFEFGILLTCTIRLKRDQTKNLY